MGDQRPDAVPGWIPPDADQVKGRKGEPSKQSYYRSMAWTLLGWVVAVGVVSVVAQVFGLQQLGGWLGLAGFVLGIWFGGVRGGITERRQWAIYVLIVLGVAFLLIGVGSCVAAMAMYG